MQELKLKTKKVREAILASPYEFPSNFDLNELELNDQHLAFKGDNDYIFIICPSVFEGIPEVTKSLNGSNYYMFSGEDCPRYISLEQSGSLIECNNHIRVYQDEYRNTNNDDALSLEALVRLTYTVLTYLKNAIATGFDSADILEFLEYRVSRIQEDLENTREKLRNFDFDH